VVDDLYMVQDGETVPFTTQFTSSRQPPQKRFIVDPVFFVRTNKPGFRSLRLGVTKPLMRNAFLKEHGIRYDEQVRFCEDMRLYLQCLLHGARFVVEPEPYYYRRKHGGSITAGNIVQLLEKEWQASPEMLNAPLIQEDEALRQAITQRTDELRRHLAFRRLQHALESRAWGKALLLLNWDALSFLVRRLFDRIGGAFFLRNKLGATSLSPRVAGS
jgi:succinoglycan biosynthesis protein ExoO